MSNSKNYKLKKSQTQTNIIEENKIAGKLINKIELKKETKENKSQEKPGTKSSFLGGGSGFFSKSSEVNIKKEPLGSFYEERKKIIFGKININKEQYYICQFLLNSQKKINNEFTKMSSGSSFFFDVPQKVYNFTLGLKENVANFCLIIRLYLLYNKKDMAFEIYLLMCKENTKLIEFIYTKLNLYCKKASPAMLRFTPTISKMFIQILSCFIKLSGKFAKSTLQNNFCVLYIKTIYILTLREMHKNDIISYKNDLNYHRLYLYSSCLFDCSLYNFYRYQPLSFSTYMLQHIMELYQEKNPKDNSRYEQVLLLKVNYNLGLFFYVDGINSGAINSLMQAKKILSEMAFFGPINKIEEKETFEIGRNSAILDIKKDKNLLGGLTFFKGKINNLDDETINNIISEKLSKKNLQQKKGLRIINEENNNKETETKKQSVYSTRNSSSLFLGIRKIELKQPLLFEHIKRKVFIEIELLLTQIELSKKNYRGALEHINIILNRERVKDDFESDPLSKKKTFNIINKTFKNLKSFQGIRTKKLKFFGSEKTENSNNINNKDYFFNNEDKILTENDIKAITLLLEKIEHDYTEHLQIENRNGNIKRNNYLGFSSRRMKSMNYTNFKEMEKFFIFICGLSFFQLKILNESQPKLSSKRNDLPIIFPNQFQDCLTNSQRVALSQLETMSLSRYIILIDSDKDISPENLDYKYMKHKIKTSINKNNEDDIELKNTVEEKGKTIHSRKSNDSGMNTISTNNINTISLRRNNKKEKEFEFEEENCMFDILLIKIKNENNKNFIESHKKCILQILNNLSIDDKKLFQNSPLLLKNLLNDIEMKMNAKHTISRSNSYSSPLENVSLSFSKTSS